MTIRWDPLKNAWLKRARGLSFEDVLRGRYIGVEKHPSRPHQMLMLFEVKDYIRVVPYVRTGDDIFLKTAFPSRTATKRWNQGE